MAPRPSLFRQEAIEFQRLQRDFGDIALLQPVATKVLIWLLAVVVAIALVFVYLAQFSRKQVVAGYLVPTAGTAKIYPGRDGVITDLYVKEGQQVAAGDALFVVGTREIAGDGENISAVTADSLHQQREMLSKRIDGEQRSAATERERLGALLASIQSEIGDLRGQIELQAQRIQLAEGLVDTAKELLGKGYMSAVEARRREDVLLEQKQTLVTLRRELAAKRTKLTETQYALKDLPTATSRKIQPLRDQMSDVEQKIIENKRRSSYVVRAPVAGRIAVLQSGIGQAVRSERMQLEIVPDENLLRVELLIPTRAAGFLKTGQEVRFLYDAFPYQNYGTYTGRITEISRTVLTKADITGPIAPEEPVYKALAALDQPYVDANGKQQSLRAGMLLKAQIILDRRSLMRWIVDPFLYSRF